MPNLSASYSVSGVDLEHVNCSEFCPNAIEFNTIIKRRVVNKVLSVEEFIEITYGVDTFGRTVSQALLTKFRIMISKIIGVKKVITLLILFTGNFLLTPTITMCQLRYTGVSDQYRTGSKGILPDGLVASYDFGTYTSTGLLKDFGPYGNHGKNLRNIDTLGFMGKARVFSTLADIVVLPDHSSLNLEGPITVAVWVKISAPNQHQHIFACNDKFVLWTTKTNKFRFADTQGNGFTTLEGTVKTDGWHSVIAVWTGTKGDKLSKDNIKIFVDGIQLDGTYQNSWNPGTMMANNACVIGSTLHGAKGHQELPFEGAIDELQVFSRALNADEIKAHATK